MTSLPNLASLTAAQAIANFKTKGGLPPRIIIDSSAGVALLLDQLKPLAVAGGIASISLTDSLPLLITYASWFADAQVLALLPPGYSLILGLVPAASARTIQLADHVSSFSVTDTTSAVVANLDALSGMTRLKAIVPLNGDMLTITASQYAADAAALAKLAPDYQLTVTGVTASAAFVTQAGSHVIAFTVVDTAANVAANLAALNADAKLSSVTLTGATALTLTSAQFTMYGGLLGKLSTLDTLIVTGASALAGVTLQANARVSSFSVTDSSAQIAATLGVLNGMTKLTSIVLTDQVALGLTYAQFAASTVVLGKLPANATIIVSGVASASAAMVQGYAKVLAFNVTDTAAKVVANLSALNAATKLQSIALTDTASLAITATQLDSYASVFSKLSSIYVLTVSGVTAAGASAVQANVRVRTFTVIDSSVKVAASLDALNGCGRLTSIYLTDTQTLVLGFAQFSNDAYTLAKISGAWLANVGAVSAVAAASTQANAHVTSFSVTDTASGVAGYLDALNVDGKLTSIDLTGGTILSVTARQVAGDAAALNKIRISYQLNVRDATVSDLSRLLVDSRVVAIQVSDTTANILSSLPILNNSFLVKSILLTDGSALTVNYSQLIAYGNAFNILGTGVVLNVNGVAAANAHTAQTAAWVSSFAISDTAANIVANLDNLNADGKLSSVAVSGSSVLSLGYTAFMSDSRVLSKITGAYSMCVSGVAASGASLVAANTHVTQFTVSDQFGGIVARLDQLEAAVKSGKLTSIAVTDTGGSTTISQAQYAADADAIALMHGSFSIYQPTVATHATINLLWDAKALAAPAAFRSAIGYAAQYLQSLITNPVTINITVGYGEVAGSSMGLGVLGAAGPTQGIGQTYAQFRNYLATHVTSATMQTIVNNMLAADPSKGGSIYVASAEEKALGLLSGTSTAIDGTMGFAADPNGTLFTYDPNNRAVAGKYDLIGVAEHELSHALGRIAMGGTYGNWISALDVFRYAAPGVHAPNAGGNAYFSIDNGNTNLNWFANSSDLGDWASSAGNDANNAYSNGGVVNQFTQTDIAELNALGFATSGTPSANTSGQSSIIASAGLNAGSLTFVGSPSLAFMTEDVPIIDAKISPASGIEEIAWFEYGVNELRIDMQGVAPSAFVAFDTMVDGQHAIALTQRADIAHGLVLTNMPANETAADLMAHHLTFASGQAFVA